MITFGIVGMLTISYALWLKNEQRQNVLFILGGACLLVYSIFIRDAVFIALQIIFMISAALALMKSHRK